MAYYKMKDITRILEIKRTALQKWIKSKYFKPSIQEAAGHGTRNIWSLVDIFKLGTFKELRNQGFSREEAAKFINKKDMVSKIDGKTMFVERPDIENVIAYEDLAGSEIHAVQIYYRDDKGHEFPLNFILESRPDHEVFSDLIDAFQFLVSKGNPKLLFKYKINATRIINLSNVRNKIAEKL